MAAAIARMRAEGWGSEDQPRCGFVFIRRASTAELTPRNPLDDRPQSFSRFR